MCVKGRAFSLCLTPIYLLLTFDLCLLREKTCLNPQPHTRFKTQDMMMAMRARSVNVLRHRCLRAGFELGALANRACTYFEPILSCGGKG
jgi:hypothetical protein